ncbi:DeoR/GlpR family DNA-binding transcription regulator [Paenibacillus sp. CAA11]|uniref:DeoR/GlpR family DNA-binding transcription regulator n=1 Tax=Paenibacillus sp. CAA11 TaxID=1532905 RepID=UPI0019014EE6|nr:DeoR/GlpR family DNA-binding transcription regulator [Paenibacillus sp. CAA11]
MFEEERKQSVIQYLQRHQRASVQELSEAFEVSESTIRRDLKELEEAKQLKRTHGGAVSLQSANFEPNMIEKEDFFREEKERIARLAAELIQEGDTILLDSGTTTLHLARELRKLNQIRVITNSLIVLNELRDCRNIEVSLTGGLLRQETLAFVGPMTETSLDMVRVDKAFIATNGIDLRNGITTPNMIEAATKRKMIEIAKEVILLTDHSKIGQIAYAKFADLTALHQCIFDVGAPDEFIKQLRKLGVAVTLA